MRQLNLPDFDYKLQKSEGKVWIFDVIRKKFIVLTPEEWVRQHFINYLIIELQYPKALIRVEGGLTFNQLQKRSDIVVFDRNGKPWMIVECKSSTVDLSIQSLLQVSTYNASVKAGYIAITNGLKHYCAQVDWQQGKTEVLDSFPKFPD